MAQCVICHSEIVENDLRKYNCSGECRRTRDAMISGNHNKLSQLSNNKMTFMSILDKFTRAKLFFKDTFAIQHMIDQANFNIQILTDREYSIKMFCSEVLKCRSCAESLSTEYRKQLVICPIAS